MHSYYDTYIMLHACIQANIRIHMHTDRHLDIDTYMHAYQHTAYMHIILYADRQAYTKDS